MRHLYFSILIFHGLLGSLFAQTRHRCGATAPVADHNRMVWAADRPFAAGSWGYTNAGVGVASTSDPIGGTLDDALYQTERYGPNVGYRYDGLANGIYDVTLKFCELYWTEPRKRIFDIAINGLLLLDDLDIYTRVGHDFALDFVLQVKVTNGTLQISVPQVKADYAKFAAISVIPGSKDSTPPLAPTNLSAYRKQNMIEVVWRRNSESDLQGYNVYRSLNIEGPFTKLNSGLLKSATDAVKFTDRTADEGESYYYAVSAVDASDNESALSSITKVRPAGGAGNYWPVPECAWSQPLGSYPSGATGRAKRGVPLGGIGAGNFMYNLCGTFGPWEFKTGTHEEKFLPQAAFHVFEQINDQPPSVRTLATEDVLPAWPRLFVGEGSYYALYPKAWFTYNAFATSISLKQFTPIIPHNYKETSYPIGVFQFKVNNPLSDSATVAFMFSFPNADYANDSRKGYISRLVQQGAVIGVVLKADSPSNPATTQNSEWCIAALAASEAQVSYVTSWNKDGDGSDLYADFADDGALSNRSLDASYSAGAVAVKLTLPPGAETIVPFVLTWDFPRVRFGEGTEWYRRYTQYFDFSAGNSFAIAVEALQNYPDWEAQVDAWQRLITDEPLYPDWLKQGALNELYYDTFGGVFWENGCITKPQESSYGTLPPNDHKYFSMECQDYAFSETFDVRHYECRHYLELWPEIEHDVLTWFADYIANDPQGRAPHDAGMPSADPFFRFSGYGADWQDMPSKFIQQAYAYYKKTGDLDFLDFVWPACKKTFAFMKTRDTNQNYLPNQGNTTYDAWGLQGDNLLCGGLWVGALEALQEMATLQNDGMMLREVNTYLTNARILLDTFFWQQDLGYYKIDAGSNAIMADGLNGQRFCETTGLPAILPNERIRSHLRQVFLRCVAPLKDYTGDGIGDLGAVNGRKANGSPIGNGQADEVWSGTSYFIAAMMYHWGKLMNDEELCQWGLQTGYGVYYQTWVNEETAYFFNTPEAWSSTNPAVFRAQQYQRPRAIWELLLEIKNPFDSLAVHVDEPVGNDPATPLCFELSQNYPNPFNATTTIRYALPKESWVTLTVYNMLGQHIADLIHRKQEAGDHEIEWEARTPSGLYLCKMEAISGQDKFTATQKMLLVR